MNNDSLPTKSTIKLNPDSPNYCKTEKKQDFPLIVSCFLFYMNMVPKENLCRY